MIRVLYVHNGSDLYGASRSLLRLVSRTPSVEFHVALPTGGPLAAALLAREIQTTIIPGLSVLTRQLTTVRDKARFVGGIARSASALSSLAREKKVDVVHTNVASVVSSGLGSRLAGIPHVWHVRDSFREFRRLWPPYSRYILTTADAVICVSQSVAEQFPVGHPKVHVVHNGLPLDEFDGIAADQVDAFRNGFGFCGSPTIGVVGRIKLRRKGQDFVIRAMDILRSMHPNAKCVFIGSPFPGNEQHLVDLKRMIADRKLEDRIVFTGDVSDVKVAIKSLDVLVMASCEPEPFAGVVLEAMALRVPVVGTRIGGTIEQVQDGISGLLVEPNDDAALAAALNRILSDRPFAQLLTTAARFRLEREFSFSRMRDRIVAVYESCISGHHRDAA